MVQASANLAQPERLYEIAAIGESFYAGRFAETLERLRAGAPANR